MLSFLSQNIGNIIIGALVLLVLVLIVVKLVNDRRKGKACGCGCDSCPSSEVCHKE